MHQHQGSLKSYIVGFVLSVILTLFAYLSVVNHLFSGEILVFVIAECCVVQLLVQLFFFLHIGSEGKQKWNLALFLFTVGIILVVVIGSIWIMNHLNYQMMGDPSVDQFILQDEGIKQ